jgi:hypothetical protein
MGVSNRHRQHGGHISLLQESRLRIYSVCDRSVLWITESAPLIRRVRVYLTNSMELRVYLGIQNNNELPILYHFKFLHRNIYINQLM